MGFFPQEQRKESWPVSSTLSIGSPLTQRGGGIPDSTVTAPNGVIAEAGANNLYQQIQPLRRPGRGRRALRLAAKVFLRLLTRPPLRPFSLLASFLALLRTKPPNRPSATACGFFCFCFLTIPLHSSHLPT